MKLLTPIEIQSSVDQTGDHAKNPTEIQSSDGKRKQSDQSENGTVSKYCSLS